MCSGRSPFVIVMCERYAVSYVLISIAGPLERPCIELSSSTTLIPLRPQSNTGLIALRLMFPKGRSFLFEIYVFKAQDLTGLHPPSVLERPQLQGPSSPAPRTWKPYIVSTEVAIEQLLAGI